MSHFLSSKSITVPPEPEQSFAGIRLDHFLKICGATGTGGQAKTLIQSGEVIVNGETELRRRRKLVAGDVVEIEEYCFAVNDFISG